jgi:hypothetical protein
MPFNNRAIPLTPEERRRRLAALLATGLLRLGSALRSPPSPSPDSPEKPSESSTNQLADSADKSVTVSPG